MDRQDIDIIAVSIGQRQVITADNRVCEITDLFDSDGDRTETSGDVVSIVAKYADDMWLVIDMREFIDAPTH